MEMFYLAAVCLLALSLVYWFIAVRSDPKEVETEQQALAREQVNTYRLRLRELAFAKRHDELDANEYESSVNQLKRQLLHDLSVQGGSGSNRQFALLVPGLAFLIIFVGAFYYANGEQDKFNDWQNTLDKFPALGKRAMMNEGEPLTAQELQQFALGLRTKLFEQDDDAIAWWMLGQVTRSIQDMESSLLAFEKAYKLNPVKESILIDYSRALLMVSDRESIRKAAGLLGEVLKQNPNSIDALMMVGYVAEQMGQQDKAVSTWNLVASLMSEGDPRLGFVKEKLAGQDVAQNAGDKVTVQLSLDDSVKGKLPTGAILFVYAKAAKGPPMPAAVVKLSDFNFPMTIELSDDNAMLPDYKLSTLGDIIIWSRVSIDGNIAVAPGELQGQSQVFTLKDTTEVAVVINQVL